MKRLRDFCAILMLGVFAAFPAAAEIKIEGLWIRATAGAGKVTGGFGTIRNTGVNADDLVAVHTPVAATGQIHEASHEGGVMRMDQIAHLEIPAGAAVSLAPGAGHHFMLMGVTAPLKPGDLVEVTLVFRDAGPIKAMATVKPLSAPK
ncbi:MAG: copper chaperone PCu(A)C [Rhodospirillaceae bacterium]|nr:copper chaperone PCu(A)C [Rhodospirillaceae bacterium]